MKMASKTQNMPKMWEKLQNEVDSDDSVSFIAQVSLVCSQRAAQVNSRIVMEKQKLFSKLISKNDEENPEDITARSYGMEGHAEKCVERFCELAYKTIDQLHKVSTLRLGDHQVKTEDLETAGETAQIWAQIV